MFVEFDETKYPVVRVNFSGVIRNENDFNEFTNKWIEL